MCGIFGYSFKHNKLSAARRAVLATNLARWNDDRGGNSWGVVGIVKDDAFISRGLGELSDNAYELCNYNALFAHTRFATHGEVSIKNAHPFKIGNILGAHNGMIYNHSELCKKYHRSFEVDSMHIFAHLNEGLPFNELEGYGAIEWIRRDNPREIYLSKLYKGELSVYGIGTDDNVEGIVWSSSYRHLAKSLFCAGINEYFRYEVRPGNVYMVSNGAYSIIPSTRLDLSKVPFRQASETQIVADDNVEKVVNESLASYKGLPFRRTRDFRLWTSSFGI